MQLEPMMPALVAVQKILQQQFEVIQANEAGTLAAIEKECLHDFRVAVRRTRSLLGQMKKVFPATVWKHFRQEFAWLGKVTGPTRDLDVYLLDFPRYQAALPVEQQSDLEPLKSFLQRHQQQKQRLLAKRLDGKRYQKLLVDWQKWLSDETPKEQPGDLAAQPILPIASRRIRKMFRLVIRKGESIGPETQPPVLHELRKNCKKLRYLLEFFASLYPDPPLGKIIKALKGLQDNLGTFQDLTVQTEALHKISLHMAKEGQVPKVTLRAMEILIEHLLLGQLEVRRGFHKCFVSFAAESTGGASVLFSRTWAKGQE